MEVHGMHVIVLIVYNNMMIYFVVAKCFNSLQIIFFEL